MKILGKGAFDVSGIGTVIGVWGMVRNRDGRVTFRAT